MTERPPILFNEVEFGKFFSKYRLHFVRIAFSYVRDSAAAKDIVADSFMYVWEHRDKLDWSLNIKGYIYFGVRSRCISHLRKQQNYHKARDEITETEMWKIQSGLDALYNNDLSRKLFQAEIIEILQRELAKMPELTRAVFMASRKDDMTHAEIAGKLRLTPRRVAYEMQKALEILRLSLADYLL